ncbi:MAG: GlgB N-terminal domain-containing protein, partial [Gammaproteobacteria bacterium]
MDTGLQRVIEARHHDPFAVLGPHRHDGQILVRAFLPNAKSVTFGTKEDLMRRIGDTGLFEWQGVDADLPQHYDLHWVD